MKQKIVIKVQMVCDKCRSKTLKIAAAADGVASVALEGPERDQVVVIGNDVDVCCLISSLTKKVGHASIVSVEEVKPPPPPPPSPPPPPPPPPPPSPPPPPCPPPCCPPPYPPHCYPPPCPPPCDPYNSNCTIM